MTCVCCIKEVRVTFSGFEIQDAGSAYLCGRLGYHFSPAGTWTSYSEQFMVSVGYANAIATIRAGAVYVLRRTSFGNRFMLPGFVWSGSSGAGGLFDIVEYSLANGCGYLTAASTRHSGDSAANFSSVWHICPNNPVYSGFTPGAVGFATFNTGGVFEPWDGTGYPEPNACKKLSNGWPQHTMPYSRQVGPNCLISLFGTMSWMQPFAHFLGNVDVEYVL